MKFVHCLCSENKEEDIGDGCDNVDEMMINPVESKELLHHVIRAFRELENITTKVRYYSKNRSLILKINLQL